MNFVIYGAGYRGKRCLEYIGAERVSAFIDMDAAKQQKEYCGKPVIPLDEYIREYVNCFIIITPVFSNGIEDFLERNNIYQYSNLMDMPSEFAGYGNGKFEDCFGKLKIDYSEKCCIYGMNALAFMLYDFLHKSMDISVCMEADCDIHKIQWAEKYFPDMKLKGCGEIQSDETILMSMAGRNEKITGKKINLFDYVSSNILYKNEKILQYKNSFEDTKKCFIVATGPSLCVNDLHILESHHVFCFGVNSILRIEEEWVPDAYVVSDSNFISNHLEAIADYPCRIKFIGDSCAEYWKKEHDDSYKIHVTTAGEGISFSTEIEQKVIGGYGGTGTVTYVCLQLAAYMGFTEIYLLGVDCNYVMGSRNNHFIAEETGDNRNHREDAMIKAYEYAKQYAGGHGIKIYNATRGGMLEVFERVDFDSLFEGKGWDIRV